MEITQVIVRKIFGDNRRLRAIVSVTFDDELAVHDIKVIQGDGHLFVAMPSRKDETGIFRDIVHPVGTPFRAKLEAAVFAEYEARRENPEDSSESNMRNLLVDEPEPPDLVVMQEKV